VLEGSRIGHTLTLCARKRLARTQKSCAQPPFRIQVMVSVSMAALLSCSRDHVSAIRSPSVRESALPEHKNPALNHLSGFR